MTLTKKLMLFAFALMLLPAVASAQIDQFGAVDTIFAELSKIDDFNWSITVKYSNDENVIGMSVPFKFSAGTNRIVGDSAIYTGGRVEHWTVKTFRPDTSIQCVTMGMIANLGPTNKTLEAGKGRLVTIFVSSLDHQPIDKLMVDTTTTSPNNSLMIIADRFQGGEHPDTIPINERERLEIKPHFVVIQPK